MPGKYLKSAMRACAGKAKFDSPQEAERTAEYRFRAYQCAVCHKWHLTSKAGPASRPGDDPAEDAPTKKAEPLATLADIEWGRLEARPPKAKESKVAKPAQPARAQAQRLEQRAEAICAGPLRKDGRVILILDGTLVKSQPILAGLRARIKVGGVVAVAPSPKGPIVVEVVG